ncbi:hypothetical protein QBC46DRAFT_454626 [Diplogelasinospora grovesii]|uniref:Uncharacterized protein n=1 Tax=Diplogelasinospora grovesii TaxID=303347 RepID=A0AAN6MVR2_9PEZI|nr:hypothetical protein QBC46DRAFT_454626 [Diplogelasinospora grovesii]
MDNAPLDFAYLDDDNFDYGTPKLPDFDCRSESPADRSQLQRSEPGLPLLQLADWNPNLPYNECPPTCVHYSIVWKLQLKKVRATKLTGDTERNLVLAPGAFWDRTLKSKLEDLLKKNTPPKKCYKPHETNIAVSTQERSETDLSMRFDEWNIVWKDIEDQLRAWSNFFRAGKKLTINISFFCMEETQTIAVSTQSAAGTAAQHVERDDILLQNTIWNDVYALMRCPGHPCKNQGGHCWRNPDSKKHFFLDGQVLTKLVRYAEEGNPLKTHKDVPEFIRELIYAKEQAASERKLKRKGSLCEGGPPIKIVNVLPPHYGQASMGAPPVAPARRPANFSIPNPRDKAIRAYCDWHCRQVDDPEWKQGFQKACAITLREGFDLRHVYQDQDVKIFVTNGVKPGIARSFIDDVEIWVKETKAS